MSVVETLRTVTETTVITETTTITEERYKAQNPESMNETFMSESEDEGMFSRKCFTSIGVQVDSFMVALANKQDLLTSGAGNSSFGSGFLLVCNTVGVQVDSKELKRMTGGGANRDPPLSMSIWVQTDPGWYPVSWTPLKIDNQMLVSVGVQTEGEEVFSGKAKLASKGIQTDAKTLSSAAQTVNSVGYDPSLEKTGDRPSPIVVPSSQFTDKYLVFDSDNSESHRVNDLEEQDDIEKMSGITTIKSVTTVSLSESKRSEKSGEGDSSESEKSDQESSDSSSSSSDNQPNTECSKKTKTTESNKSCSESTSFDSGAYSHKEVDTDPNKEVDYIEETIHLTDDGTDKDQVIVIRVTDCTDSIEQKENSEGGRKDDFKTESKVENYVSEVEQDINVDQVKVYEQQINSGKPLAEYSIDSGEVESSIDANVITSFSNRGVAENSEADQSSIPKDSFINSEGKSTQFSSPDNAENTCGNSEIDAVELQEVMKHADSFVQEEVAGEVKGWVPELETVVENSEKISEDTEGSEESLSGRWFPY